MIANVGGDRNDLSDGVVSVFRAKASTDQQSFAERIAVRPEALRHRLVDDRDAGRSGVVAWRKRAAAQDRNPQRLEITGGDEGPPGERVEGSSQRPAQDDERKLPDGFERNAARRARNDDAWKGLESGGRVEREARDPRTRFERRALY